MNAEKISVKKLLGNSEILSLGTFQGQKSDTLIHDNKKFIVVFMPRSFSYFLFYIDLIIIVFVSFRIIKDHTSIIKPPIDNYCDWNSSTTVGSTSRDVVLLYATKLGKGLFLCIKSLRSTGSKCRIILFVPQTLQIVQSQLNLFDFYMVEIVKITPHKRKNVEVPHMDRYEHEMEWLSANINDVDRVLHTDSFDVFFQGDPFTSALNNETLTLALEPHQFRSCGWNLAWLRDCYGGDVLSKLHHSFILCSGSIGGSAKHYLALVKLMIDQPQWTSCWESSMDQPILNYLVWTGKLKEAGINYTFTGCNDGFFTMQWCVKNKNVLFNEHGQFVSLEDTVPVYVHQYNRYHDITNYLYEKCGIQ